MVEYYVVICILNVFYDNRYLLNKSNYLQPIDQKSGPTSDGISATSIDSSVEA